MDICILNLLKESCGDTKKMSCLHDEFLIPKKEDKKTNGEVSTPYILRQQMLDKIDDTFWMKPQKVFEPCSGKGGFLIDIIDRFMDGMRDLIPDKEERYKTILQECIYYVDINPLNIHVCNSLLNSDNKYNLNYYEGDTLKLDIKDKWNLDGFDLVVGNPPYNQNGCINSGNIIWNKFVKKAINDWVIPNGELLFIHPAGWRKPDTLKSKTHGFFKMMCHDNYMKYLEIHNIKDGMKMFKCGTKYDWYVIQKKQNKNGITTIVEDDGNVIQLNLNTVPFLPNRNIKYILKHINQNCNAYNVMYSRSKYDTRQKYVSLEETEIYKYPVVYTTPKKGVRYLYTSDNTKGFFGIPKVIIGDSGVDNAVLDFEGKYGVGAHVFAIKINTLDEGLMIKKVLNSNTFKKEFIIPCIWGNFKIERELFTYFDKDFWKEFKEI